MADDKEVLDEGRDNGSTEATERVEKTERTEREHPRDQRAGKDTREQIRAAMREVKEKKFNDEGDEVKPAKPREGQKEARPRGDNGKFASPDKAGKEAEAEVQKTDPASKEIPPKGVNEEANPTPPQAKSAIAPPDALSKDIKAMWDQIPEAVQKEFARREDDGKRGVEQLKARYQPIDEAIHPLRDELRAIGKTEAEGVRMLADWRNALRGPHKVQAFRALAQAEGIDLTQLVSTAPRQPGAPQQTQQQNDPASILRPFIDPITQKVTSLEAELQRRDAERTQADIRAFSQGKPHFDRVKLAMGHLINSGLVPGDSPQAVFDEAYKRACRADPEVYAAIQAEEQTKREDEAKASREAAEKKAADDEAKRKREEAEAVERARKASVGPRNGSPAGMSRVSAGKGQSVGASLRQAIRETGRSI